MKQIIKLSIPVLMALAGCSQALEPDASTLLGENGSGSDVTIGVTMPDAGDAKTVLGAKSGSNYPVYWQEGDKVTMNGALSAGVPASAAGTNKVSFVVKSASGAPYNVLYPGIDGNTDKVTFPSTQAYTAGTFAANSLPMYATSGSLKTGFQLQYLGSVLRIPVKFTSATTLKHITLTSVGGEALSGTFTVGNTSGALNGELTAYSAATTTYYDFGAQGTKFNANATGVFYIAIPKGTYSKGIEMKVYDTDGNYMKTALFTENGDVAAGKVYEFTQRSYNPDGTVFFIENVSDLQAFVNKGGDRYCLLEALVLNDINMSGKEYKANDFNFYGNLDGGGHTISGLTKPLFNNLYGSVRNITVNSNITTAVESSANKYGLGILARYIYTASGSDDEEGDYGQVLENITTKGSISVSYSPDVDFSVGGMLGANKGVPMNSCENQASVTITGLTPSVTGTFRVGGLAGSVISPAADISGCSNTGAVTVSGATMFDSGTIFAAGGLIGYDTKDNTVQNSTNSGAVKITSVTGVDDTAPYLMVGGIVGDARAESGFTLSGCENLEGGIVTIGSACSVQGARIGGVIGRISAASSEISGCTNRAKVDIKAATMSGSNTFGGVVGVVLGDNVSVTDSKNYGAIENASGKLDAVGGVIGYNSQNGTVDCCENYGAISSTAVPGNPQYFGGVMGKKASAKNIAFSSCKNEGDVSITCGEHDNYVFMGGVIGGCPGGSSSFANCSNSGNITNSSTKTTADDHHDSEGTEKSGSFTPAVCIGGIIGRVTDNALGTITDCTNSGDINNNCGATEIRLGGIVGYTHQKISDIRGCTNSGLVSNNVLADYCYIRIGGILSFASTQVNMTAQNTNTGKIQSNPTTRVNICGLTEGSYDDNVRIAGCLTDYYSVTSETKMVSQRNEGEIVNTGTIDCGWVYIGGLQAYAQRATYQGSVNTGYVHNEATVRVKLAMAGILARADAGKDGSTQRQAKIQSSSRNEGNVFNNGTCSKEAFIGGLCGEVAQSTDISSSTNSGMVKNTAAAATARLGGVCGYANAYVSLDNSSNSGDVIFEGSTSDNLFMAGGIGFQNTNLNALVRNVTNSGAVSCNVAVPKDLEIGGIAGEAWGKVSNCTNSGPVTIGANVGKTLYAGGVLGWLETNTNNPVSDCENTATGKISCGPITISGQVFVGGVIGGARKEKEVGATGLINRAEINLGGNDGVTTSNTGYSYIGGVCGGDTDSYLIHTNCENYGYIYYKGKHKCRLGGITAFASKDPAGSICEADIRFYCTKNGTAKSDVGGIIGYYTAGPDGTVTNCKYKGYLNTQSSSPRAYTGMLVGRQNKDVCTFKDCKVGGQVRGVGTSPYNTVAIGCCAVTSHEINFENLIVATGTKRNTTAVTSLSLNHNSTGTVGVLCYGTTSETNTTTLEEASTGTMTNCTIGSID